MADGEEDYLKWTPENTSFSSDSAEGNRWMRSSPMFSDGELIYMLVQYKETDYSSRTIKTVLETYEVNDRKMKRINELTLLKNSEGARFVGSRKVTGGGGYLARCSIACNGRVLLFHSAHNMHVFDMGTGVRTLKEHYNSTALISCYDTKLNSYFHMDAACYSWLKRFELAGFKPRDLSVKEVPELPVLPVIFDVPTKEILAQISEEKKIQEEEEAKVDYSANLYEQLFTQDASFDLFAPVNEERKRTTQSPENVHEISEALIYRQMGNAAQAADYKVSRLGGKRPTGAEMLPYIKAPLAIYGNQGLLS